MEILSYEFGKINVNGETYTSDLMLFPEEVIPNWWREQGHLLQIQDINDVFDFKPELLIVGCGTEGLMKTDKTVLEKCDILNINCKVLKSDAAVKLYNESDKQNTIAVFHLTC
jgi:hypothetical protein